jgi:hypothetical protein
MEDKSSEEKIMKGCKRLRDLGETALWNCGKVEYAKLGKIAHLRKC